VAVVRRRVRRSSEEPLVPLEPESDVAIADGFAEADVARAFSHRAGGAEVDVVTLLSEHALRYFSNRGVSRASVVMARQRRNSITLTLDAGVAEQMQIMEHAAEFGRCVGGNAQAAVTSDRDLAADLWGQADAPHEP